MRLKKSNQKQQFELNYTSTSIKALGEITVDMVELYFDGFEVVDYLESISYHSDNRIISCHHSIRPIL